MRWQSGNNTITREAFVSAPDDVLVMRIATDQPGTLAFRVRLTRERHANVKAADGGQLQLDGQIVDVAKEDGGYDDNPGGSGPGGPHMKFAARLQAQVDQGAVTVEGDRLRIAGATEALLLFTAATDYHLPSLNFDRSIDPARVCEVILAKAGSRVGGSCSKRISRNTALFNRVSLELGVPAAEVAELPTDARLAAVRGGSDDPDLIALHFQYGRYLLMASSRRPGRLPANLQGIWNDKAWAPWEADYHLNINLQMNYWPAGVANLPETMAPLVDWLELLASAVSTQRSDFMSRMAGWHFSLRTRSGGPVRVPPHANRNSSMPRSIRCAARGWRRSCSTSTNSPATAHSCSGSTPYCAEPRSFCSIYWWWPRRASLSSCPPRRRKTATWTPARGNASASPPLRHTT